MNINFEKIINETKNTILLFKKRVFHIIIIFHNY